MIPYYHRHTSKPVRDIFARASKCASGNDKSAVVRAPRAHGVVRVSAHHGAVEVVGVILGPATRVDNVGVSRTISKGGAVSC